MNVTGIKLAVNAGRLEFKWSPRDADLVRHGINHHAFQRQMRLICCMLARMGSERGQTMAEYGILIGVIAIVVVAAAVFLGSSITDIFKSTGSHL